MHMKCIYHAFLPIFISSFFLFSLSASNSPMENAPPLIFFHIPKTGGVTIVSLLENYLPRKKTGCKGGIHSTHAQVYDYLSQNPTLLQDCQLITFLRDPIERIISHHKYLIKQLKKNHSNFSVYDLPPDQDPLYSQKNTMSKTLSGLDTADSKISDYQHLEQAKSFIDHCFFVGITERMEDSLAILFDKLDLPIPHYTPKFNECFTDEFFSEELKQEIAMRNWADMELYQYALQRFEKQQLQFIKNQKGSVQTTSHYQQKIFFTFNQPVNGYGWAARQDGIYSSSENQRWVFKTNEASLCFHLDGDHNYSIRLRMIIPKSLAPHIHLYVNSVLLSSDMIFPDISSNKIDTHTYVDYVAIIPKQIVSIGKCTEIVIRLQEPTYTAEVAFLNQWRKLREQDNCSRGIFACEELEISL